MAIIELLIFLLLLLLTLIMKQPPTVHTTEIIERCSHIFATRRGAIKPDTLNNTVRCATQTATSRHKIKIHLGQRQAMRRSLITSNLGIKRAQCHSKCLQRRKRPLHIHGKIVFSYSAKLQQQKGTENLIYCFLKTITANKPAIELSSALLDLPAGSS